MPSSRERETSLVASAIAEEAAGRAMLVQTVAMFYSLRAGPMRRQLLLDMEQLHRQAWWTLRQSEVHALRVVGHMSHEYIRRQELLDQFLFERELLLEPQFIAFEEMTRKDLVRGEWGHRKYLFDFAVEARIMLHGEDWLFQDPDELLGSHHNNFHQLHTHDADETQVMATSSSRTHTPRAAQEKVSRHDDFDDLTSDVLDAMFVPSLPPPDRRGWVPGIEEQQRRSHSSSGNHHKKSHQQVHHHQRHHQGQQLPPATVVHAAQSGDRFAKATRPSTASIYRHRDNIVESPQRGKDSTTPSNRPPWHDRPSSAKTVVPSRPSSARKPASRMVLIRHATNRPNGENHREQPYFTSHYCTPSPPARLSTGRPISASRSAPRLNHGSPLLMLTGKHASIAQTKEMLRHMPLEEVERLVPMIRLPRLDLSYRATPSVVADREARRLFAPSSATNATPSTLRSLGPQHRASSSAAAAPLLTAAPCDQHRSHHSIFGEGPPLAFLSFSSPFPNSSLVTLPLESLVATLYALQVEQLTQAPEHVVRLLRSQFASSNEAVGGRAALVGPGGSLAEGDDEPGASRMCPWCVAEAHQRQAAGIALPQDGMPQITADLDASPQTETILSPSHTLQTSLNTRGTSVSPRQSITQAFGASGSDRRNHSLREHLLNEFPFLRGLHADRDLCHVPIEVLDPQRDREFAAASRQWKDALSEKPPPPMAGSTLLANPSQHLGRTPSFHHGNHHNTPSAAHQQNHPTQAELEGRMRARCIRLAQEYQRGRILEIFPFVPPTVDGVPVEELPLLEDAEFCRLAETFAASESAGRVPTLKHENRVMVGNVLQSARERFFGYLDAFGKQYQERVLRTCCPQLYVTPPSSTWPGPHDASGHSTAWCAFRSCFALYASPAHTLGIWNDRALHNQLMRVWNPTTQQSMQASTTEQLTLFDTILAAARKRRKALFTEAGLQARHHSWSTDELEPYLLASVEEEIPSSSKTLSVIRQTLKHPRGTVVVMMAESVARYQHWVLTDCIPALIQRPTVLATVNAAQVPSHHEGGSSLAVQYLHQATRDIVDVDSTNLWWQQEAAAFRAPRAGSSATPTESMSWEQYLSSLPFLRMFQDAALMNACATWIELHREGGALGDTHAELLALQQKVCCRVYALAHHWCVHEQEEREVHLRAIESLEQRWNAVSDRLLTTSLYKKRMMYLTAEEPTHRRHIQQAYAAHRAELLYALSSRAAEEDLERYLQFKERWLFLSVALCRRSEYERAVITPAMSRLEQLAASLNKSANSVVNAHLSVTQHEHVQRSALEQASQDEWTQLYQLKAREQQSVNNAIAKRKLQFEPLLAEEVNQRNAIKASEVAMRSTASRGMQEEHASVLWLHAATSALHQEESAQRDALTRLLLREMASVSEIADDVRQKSLTKERRRSSINFHLAQANALRAAGDASPAASAAAADAPSPLRRPGSFSQQRRTDAALTPSPRKATTQVPVTPHPPPSPPPSQDDAARAAAAAAIAALLVELENIATLEATRRNAVNDDEVSCVSQLLTSMLLDQKRALQKQRDRELLSQSAPFNEIFGDDSALDDAALAVVAKNPSAAEPLQESDDVRLRFFAATSKDQPVDTPYASSMNSSLVGHNPQKQGGPVPQTILRKGTTAAPPSPSGKRVTLRVGS